MPRTATAEPGGDSSRAKMRWARRAALASDGRLVDRRLRNPKSSMNMVALSVGGR